ncbi:hypothetical protein ABZ468_20055 [Streptomyces sp. NPDC005708]|uniref:luciferase domain-containing protein n=1 Tax=Streptomyces sp. NPDC005708 TaxID=3154564 RepID=UPI00340EEA8D
MTTYGSVSEASFDAPVVVMHGSDDAAAPLVVLLHGRGSHERDIVTLAHALPAGPMYAAVRAPIAEGSGFAWFANRGIGRAVPASLRVTMDWFRGWLDTIAPKGRPVVLIGFSGGAAFAGGLLLDDPSRYAGGAVLYGTLPFDAAVPTTPARLAGVPIFLAHGEHDTVISRTLLDRTWNYLTTEAGAPTIARKDPVGHDIATEALAALHNWLQERLTFISHHQDPPAGPTRWPILPGGVLPTRSGARPVVSTTIPQQQRSDNAPAEFQEQLFTRLNALPGVISRQSAISVPGARGLMLLPPRLGPAHAFLVPDTGEFAHLHPDYDGSMHLALPPVLAADAIAQGWAIAHPLAGVRLTPGMIMVYGPRDRRELDIVTAIATTSHAWATGQLA